MDRRTFIKTAAVTPVLLALPEAKAVEPPPAKPNPLYRPHIFYATCPAGPHQEAMVAVFNPEGHPAIQLAPWYNGIDRKFQGFDIHLPGDYRVSFDLVNGYLHQEFTTDEGHVVRLGSPEVVRAMLIDRFMPVLEAKGEVSLGVLHNRYPDRPSVYMLAPPLPSSL